MEQRERGWKVREEAICRQLRSHQDRADYGHVLRSNRIVQNDSCGQLPEEYRDYEEGDIKPEYVVFQNGLVAVVENTDRDRNEKQPYRLGEPIARNPF